MRSLACSVLLSMTVAVGSQLFSAPAPRAARNRFKPQTASSAVDAQDSPAALERRFGRDTLLYFPMERVSAPVALQQLITTAHAR